MYVHVLMYVCMYVHVLMYVCMYICSCMYVCTYAHVCMYICSCRAVGAAAVGPAMAAPTFRALIKKKLTVLTSFSK